jgi:predicted permease
MTLGLGIGLAIAMFTVSDAVLRRPLPVQDQGRVVVLWGEGTGSVRKLPLLYEEFERFRAGPRTLQEVAGALNPRAAALPVRDGQRALMLNLAAVTGNFFGVLGSPPVLGRALRPDDDVVGAAPVIVISHSLWRTHFNGDPSVIGHRLTLHERGVTYTVVGVAPPGLEYPAGADLWVPLVPYARVEAVPIGRLTRDATPRQAAAELSAFFRRETSLAWRDLRAGASPLPEVVTGDVRPALLILSAAAALLLLIACINVANLLLVRASGRMQEISVRHALGARRGRILRQLLTESCVLALAGGLLGIALAETLVRGLLVLAPPELPRLEEIRIAGVPLGMAGGVMVTATLAFGLLPALWASGSAASALQGGDRSTTEPKVRRRAQDLLVIAQVGLAIVVLSAAGLLGRTLRRLERLDMGFTADRLAILQLAWPGAKFDSPEKLYALYDRLVPRVEALPDVVSAAPFKVTPFAGATGGIDGPFVAEGTPEAELATSPILSVEVVGPGHFRTFGVPLLRGRAFTDADREDGPRVAVVGEDVARLFWPGEDPLGKRLAMGRPERAEDWWTVVGVVPPTRYRVLREPVSTVYLSYRQFIAGMLAAPRTLAVRTRGEPAAVVPSVRRATQETDPDVVVTRAETMERIVAGQLAQPRLIAALLGVFSAGALVLAAVGVYAVLAYLVRRRTRELAIRHALGASPSRLRSLVLRQALVIAGVGAGLGLAGALAGGRLIRSLLFGVTPDDPPTLAGVAVVLLVVALGAAYVPARRASRADPAAVLRGE